MKQVRTFESFEKVAVERYAHVLVQPLTPSDPLTRVSVLQCDHANIIPFLMLDVMAHARGVACRCTFARDLLRPRLNPVPIPLEDEAIRHTLHEALPPPNPLPVLSFQGFGPRIDASLNVISTLYLDILSTFTPGEANVLMALRRRQFEKFKDPTHTKTFGMQRQIAREFGRSTVAINKSLHRAKYKLIVQTAEGMSEILK